MSLIKKYVPIIREFKEDNTIDSIIVFGSISKKTTNPMSNLDVAILFNSKTTNEDKIKVLLKSDDKLNISDFSKLFLPLQFQFLNSGVIIKQSKELETIKSRVKAQWMELKPGLKSMYEDKAMGTLSI